MVKIDLREAQALSAISGTSEGDAVLEWLRRSRDEAITIMSKGENQILVGRGQGSYDALNTIIEHYERAHEIADKLRR